jgi:hypothetical protein
MKLVIAAAFVAACGTPAAAPRGPEHDLDEPQHHDAGVTVDAAGSGSAIHVTAPGVDDAEKLLAALAADIHAAITTPALAGPDLNQRCIDADIKLDKLRPRALAAAPSAVLVRRDSVRAQHLASELPITELSAAITACRVRYQMELPGMEALIDDLQALVPDR